MIILETLDVCLKLEEVTVFQDINIKVKKNEKIVVDGATGSGKSIFMKLISGLIEPTSGQIYFNGKALHYLLDRKFFKDRKEICYFLEGLLPLANLSVLENIALVYQINTNKSHEEIKNLVYQKLIQVNLEDKIDIRPSFLSPEEKMVLNVLMNMKEDSKIFFIDEIFTFLNESIKEKIKKIILKELQSGEKTVIMCRADHDVLNIAYDKEWRIDRKHIQELLIEN